MIKKVFVVFVFLYSVLSVHAQSSLNYKGITIQHGDFLFVGAQAESLSGAINRVTQRTASASFDHMGLIEVVEGVPYILHASSRKGCVREPLDNMAKHYDVQQYVIYRIDDKYKDAIPEAMAIAHQMVGKPYNWSYRLNDSSYYCSDFVERAFRPIGLFKLEPMTFKNPKTGEFDEFWVKFYAKQGMEVPEGELGCNPNGLAANPDIHRIGALDNKK